MNDERDYGFQSGGTASQILFPETKAGFQGIPLPHNFGRFSQSAVDVYMSSYYQAQLLGCTPRKAHTSAMEQVKKTHILRDGKWILPEPMW